MKIESRKRPEPVFFLAAENMLFHVSQPFKIRQDMIEIRNFIPEAFIIHQFHESVRVARGTSDAPARMSALTSLETEPTRWLSLLQTSEDPSFVLKDEEDDE